MLRLADFKIVWPLVREERRSYLAGVVLVALTCAFWIAVPKLVGSAIQILETGARVDMVPRIALAILGAVLLRGITSYLMRNILIGASRRIEYRLRNRLFRKLEELDASYFVKARTGDLINRFTSDVEAVRAVVGPGVMYTSNTIFTLLIAVALMVQVSPSLTLYTILPLTVLTITMRILGPKVNEESRKAQERLSDINVQAQEDFSNVRVIKTFVREVPEYERMEQRADEFFHQNMRLAKLRGWINSMLFLIGDLALLFLLALGGWALLEERISLGEFVAFKGYQLVLIWPMLALGWVINIFQRGAASAVRLRDVLEAMPVVDDRLAEADRNVSHGDISFRGVGFDYKEVIRESAAADAEDGEKPRPSRGQAALTGVDFDLRGGQTLGIVGPTGSGKTTLMQLVPRIYPPTTGTITVDGQELPKIPLSKLREAIGIVPQEAFLFSATIAENIAFALPEATREQICEVARLVCVHDEIEGFPDGYEQRVGERGITLSGGQKQRIALARALLKRPRILLLDDVLSAVDARTEATILSGLQEWTRDLTTLIVSHRLSAVRHADQILVLSDGEIIQRGTHDELVNTSGYYSNLYRRQSLEEELEGLE